MVGEAYQLRWAAGGEEALFFSDVAAAELLLLGWVVPYPRQCGWFWLNPAGHRAKTKNRTGRMGTRGMGCWRGRRVGGQRDVTRMRYRHALKY